jgi:phosphoglycerol transferase MdoB-like AlkP superfamily enzyme
VIFFQLIFIELLGYSLVRVLFLGWNWTIFNTQTFVDLLTAFLIGIRFDLAVISVTLIPVFLTERIWHFLCKKRQNSRNMDFENLLWTLFAGILFIPGFIFSLGDTEFVNFTGRRMSMDSLAQLREISGKFWQIIGSYLLLFSISVFILLFLGLLTRYLWLNSKSKRHSFLPIKPWLQILIFLLLLVGIRGGWQKKPIGFAHAQIFVQPMMNNLVMNSAFTLLQTIKRVPPPRQKYFADRNEMLNYLGAQIEPLSKMENKRFEKPQNIVLIILESFNLEYMGVPFADQGYTPFLDSLAQKGLFFTNNFANARRSIEGVGAIMAGIPAWMNEPFLSSQYMTNYYLGLGTLLKTAHYETAFFHGGQNGTMYFDSFMNAIGMDHYFGANDYPDSKDFDGTWGIYDGPFLQWTKGKMDTLKSPFFVSIFTLSSHNPFKIPDSFKGKFPKGTLDIHESIGYSDSALQSFFQQAEKASWYKDTLFILTADHTYKSSRKEFANEIGEHRTPLIFFHPGWIERPELKPEVNVNQITSQIDILPSILDFLGEKILGPIKVKNYLENSVFNSGERSAITFVDGKYHLVEKDYFITLSTDQIFRLYDRNDGDEKTDLSKDPRMALRLNRMENHLKAAIQYFSEGLWDNKLYF